MDKTKLLTLLQEGDYYIDSLGRLVIANEEILQAYHGAIGQPLTLDVLSDVGCSNSGCGG